MSNKQLAFLNLRDDHKYFTIIPNIVFKKGLSLPDFKLYATITKIAGPRGTCYMSTGRLAQEAGISVGAVSKSKQKLKDEGLITIMRRKRSAHGHAIDHIALIDIWKENILHFVKPSPCPDKPSPGELKPSRSELKPSPGETEEEPFKKNQEEDGQEPKSITEHFEDVMDHLRKVPRAGIMHPTRNEAIAATAEFCALCFGGKPEYGRIGRIGKMQRHRYRRICQVALECVAKSPRGDAYAYLEACLKGDRGGKEKQDSHARRGPAHRVADQQEFDKAREEVQQRKAAADGG